MFFYSRSYKKRKKFIINKQRIKQKLYYKRNIGLAEYQLEKLASAIENEKPVSFWIYHADGNVPVYLTSEQLEGLPAGKPLKFGKKQLAYMKTQGVFWERCLS